MTIKRIIEDRTYYFENLGVQNTEHLLNIAKKKAIERDVKYVIVDSTRSNTVVMVAEVSNDT